MRRAACTRSSSPAPGHFIPEENSEQTAAAPLDFNR
jgi:hypothetical protein